MKIGVTGHQHLDDAAAWPWVEREIDKLLAEHLGDLIVIGSLAVGADQLVAERALAQGGTLCVVVPFKDYERQFSDEGSRQRYRALLARADRVEILTALGSDEEAYMAAGRRVVDEADSIIAIWDGLPAAGLGGTGDVVAYAGRAGKRVIHVNPTTTVVRSLP